MVRIRYGIELSRMTGETVLRRAHISPGNVTICALHLSVCSHQRESGATMIERGATPLCRRVTELTILRVTGSNMIRCSGGVVLVEMA